MVIIGIIMVMCDSATLNLENATPDAYGYLMTKYLYR